VLAWNLHEFYTGNFERFRTGFAGKGWVVHDIVQVLPGYSANPLRYGLHRFDLHPNAAAHDLVADHIVSKILIGPAVSK
jgi:hypothetical protein